jgi:sugar phosphate isomerase/epimerase
MSDPSERKPAEAEIVQDVKDAVRDINEAIAVAAAHGIEVELEVLHHHHGGEHNRPILEAKIRKVL